jgi:hypothetical protein
MFHIQYRQLCAIFFTHSYYQNGRSTDFTLVPTEACAETMQRYGLKMVKTADRTLVMQRMDGPVPETPFEEAVRFCFLVYLNNPLLWNVSQHEWETAPGKIVPVRQFYLTNLDQTEGTLMPGLTKTLPLSAADALLPLSGERFNVDVKKGELVEIVMEQFLPVNKWVALPAVPVKPEQEIVEVKLAEPGLYRRQPVSGAEPSPVFIANDEVSSAGPLFALIDLFLNNDVAPGQTYNTYLDNRKFFWNYIFTDVMNKNVPYGQPGDIKLSFKRHDKDTQSPVNVKFKLLPDEIQPPQIRKTVEQLLKAGQGTVSKVFVFASDQPIPILQNCPPVVELSINDNQKFAKLPVPDIETVELRGSQSLIYYHI